MKQEMLQFVAASLFITSLAGCGGGGNSAATPAPAPTVNPATTAAIQANMATNYNNEQLLISNAIQSCFRQWGISGNAIICSVNAKQTSVQSFLNKVLANIQAVKINTPIDNAAIATMLSAYQIQDLAWLTVNSLSPTYTMSTAELAAVSPAYNSSVNTSYSNALVQFNAITIQANMNTNYNNEQLLLSNSIPTCFRKNNGGAAIICSVNAKQASVQSFLNTVLANIQIVKSITSIDKTAIATMLSAYQTLDLAWLTVNSLSPTYTMSIAELAAVSPAYNSSVNTSYSNAFIQLNAM